MLGSRAWLGRGLLLPSAGLRIAASRRYERATAVRPASAGPGGGSLGRWSTEPCMPNLPAALSLTPDLALAEQKGSLSSCPVPRRASSLGLL
jgi:hypothetical protein